MAKSIDVAHYFIRLAASEDEPEYLSHLRLQKLLYYVQAWSLTNRGKRLFPERIEAWANGPVVPNLFPILAGYGARPIPPEDVADEEIDLDDEERELVAGIWESYKEYSAISLSRMIHEEAPWIDARKGLGPGERCNREITVESLQSYFAPQGT